ncbi:MAG: LamG-like jellyroll fold domain-containing protein, partial [Verrucomicrobiota bacterium]
QVQDTASLFSQEVIHIEVVNQGLAARWSFEDVSGQTATDGSGNGHAGTLSGAAFGASTIPGPVGNAISLASGQYMVCDNTDLIAEPETAYPVDAAASNFFDPMDRSFTLTCWFKLGDPSQSATLFTKNNPGLFGYSLTASSSGLSTTVRPWDGNGSSYTVSSGAISPDGWYHGAMVINRADHSLRLYLNGVAVGTAATLPADKFIFNGREDLVMGGDGPVKLDEAQVYTKALTPAEIAALYASGTPPAGAPSPANNAFNVAFASQLSWQSNSSSNKHDVYFGTDPVALASATTNSPLYKGRFTPMTYNPGTLGAFNTYYWRVDVVPPTGSVVAGDVWHFTTADSPLTANLLVHLTLDNADLSGTTVEDIALAADNFNNTSALTNQAALIGQAFYFNGSNSYATSLSSDIIPTSSGGTISCWMKTTNSSSGNYIISVEGAWVIQYQGASGGVLAFLDGSSGGNPTANASLNNGAWHHIVAANDGTTTRLYVDGTLRNTYAEAIYNLNSLTRQTAVGARYDGGGNLFTGNVDDVGIWSRNLSAGEVNQIYTNGLAGKTLELVPVIIANTSFESAEGFTNYVSPNFAALGTKYDLFTNQWTGLVGDVQIWFRSDIPPNGVQCLKVGEATGSALCKLRLTGTNHGVKQVTFDYAAFSTLTDCDFTLSYSNTFTGGWIPAWTTHLTGNNPPWSTKPWPTVSVLINVVGDVDLLFTKTGAKGVLVDNFSVTAKADNSPSFTNNPALVTNAIVGAAFNATLAGRASDPDAFDAITFSKVSGPAWLNVAAGGALTGTPLIGNVGTNNFVVRVSDAWGGTNDSALTITVTNTTPPIAPVIAPSVVGSNLQLQIASQSGYNYVVQAATNLAPPIVWSNVSTNAGTGATLNLSAPISPGTPQRFFRVWAY